MTWRRASGWLLVLGVIVASAGCGGGANTSVPGNQTRSYRLAATGMRADPAAGLVFGSTNLVTDVDVVSIHNDFWGVPWDEFAANQPPPAQWVALMDHLLQIATSAHKDVFLSLALVEDGDVGRQYLAQKAVVVNGSLTTVGKWSAQCYDFATAPDGPALQTAYTRYVDWMVRKFQPRFVNVAVEMNLFFPCATGWDGLVQVERAAYDAAKAARPGVIAFPSIQIDELYGYLGDCATPLTPDVCYEANYAKLALLKRDRFAISTYPFATTTIANVGQIPANWFARAADRGREATVVAETGWVSESPVVLGSSGCFVANGSTGTQSEEAAYLDRLLNDAEAHHMDLVTYWSNRDLVPALFMTDCPCTFDAQWCSFLNGLHGLDPDPIRAEMALKGFGTMGIRRWDGTPKGAVFQRWQQALGLPLAN